MKVIIAGGGTGGHLFPAVALGEEMMRQRPATEILFVGTNVGFEAKWLPASGYKYELFKVHGIRGHSLTERIRAVGEFLRAIRSARVLVARTGPDLVVSAGGYASAPLVVSAILARIPFVLMEQNTRPGLANRMLWRFARKVCVGFDEAASFFSSAKVEITGNPIRFIPKQSYPHSVDNLLKILILGGSSGAHRLNIGIIDAFKRIEKGVIKFAAVHQAGEADVDMLRTGYQQIGLDAHVVPFIDDMASALANAHLVIARAGAMTVCEVAASARPAIFVPYPFHADRQQELNARVLERAGAAIIVRDDEHLGENLKAAIESLVLDRRKLAEMGERARAAAKPDASARIAKLCFEIADERRAA
jgi:UDP-N-acetylglucosamine--N-acetylmuramyl-(pentapeptide) pyrophosphoryl-undecaprenol N-acetylglucosamine transferase